jgi:hypothetical protein
MKATASSRRTGHLANHHRANSAITTGTVASHHTMLRHGNKTMTTTTSGRALTLRQDGLPCNLAPGLYIRTARASFQEDGLSRLHSNSSPPLSYLFHSSCIPHCKNFRAFNQGIRTRTISNTGRRAPA